MPPYDVIPESCPEYYYFYIRPDLRKATHCWRPPAAVFMYLSAVGMSIGWDYAGLWEQLVDEDLCLEDVIPAEHRVAVAVLRRLLGAPDTVAFPLPGPRAQRTELGHRPSATQLSLDTATACVRAD